MSNTKMMKSANVFDRIFNYGQWFVGLAGIILMMMTFSLPWHKYDIKMLRTIDAIENLLCLIMLLYNWCRLRMVRKVFIPLKAGNPFEAGISDKVRKLAWMTLIGGFVVECCRVLGAVIELRAAESGMNATNWFGFVLKSISFDILLIPMILFFLAELSPHGEGLLRKLAGITMVGCIVIYYCELKNIPTVFDKIYLTLNVATVNVNNNQYFFNYGFLIVGLLLLFLAWVFQYGEELQRESNETL